MTRKNKISIYSSCVLFFASMQYYEAQETDTMTVAEKPQTIAQVVKREVAEKFPRTRLINIEFGQMAPYNFTSNHKGGEEYDGKVKNVSQVNISSNINIIKSKRWSVSALLNYQYINAKGDAPNIFSESNTIVEKQEDFNYFSTSANIGYYSKLFGKTMIYSGTATVDASDKGVERLRGLLTATMVLKANERTKMTVGIIGLLDPNAIVPSFMSFSYEHKFNKGWTLDVILPRYVYVRKDISENSRLSFGSELGGTLFYLYNQDRAYTFNQMDINSGFLYEQVLGKSFILSAKTGMRYSPSSRIMDKNADFNDYIYRAKPQPGFYFNIGLSYNPFNKKTKR